jgi:diadenylate cyclase
MPSSGSLQVEYATVTELTDFITYAIESISLEFSQWDEEYMRGPGLYFVVVTGVHSGSYADALGDNRWPIGTCRVVTDDLDEFVEAARPVAHTRDGAIIISADGTVQEQMVRIKSQSDRDEMVAGTSIESADWMGTKHLSAVEISLREEVLVAITLSEEDGRMTIFKDGGYDDFQRDELGGVWRSTEGFEN